MNKPTSFGPRYKPSFFTTPPTTMNTAIVARDQIRKEVDQAIERDVELDVAVDAVARKYALSVDSVLEAIKTEEPAS